MTYVRRFVPPDIEAVLRMAREFHAESPVHSIHPFSDARVCTTLQGALASEDWLALVATDDDAQLVGFALVTVQPLYFSEDRELMDLAIYVAPDRRGGRCFMALMDRIEEWARERGASSAMLGINTGIRHDQALRSFAKRGYLASGTAITKRL